MSSQVLTVDDSPLSDALSVEDKEFFGLARALMKKLKEIIEKLQLHMNPGDRDLKEAVKAYQGARTAINDGLAALAPGIDPQAINLQV